MPRAPSSNSKTRPPAAIRPSTGRQVCFWVTFRAGARSPSSPPTGQMAVTGSRAAVSNPRSISISPHETSTDAEVARRSKSKRRPSPRRRAPPPTVGSSRTSTANGGSISVRSAMCSPEFRSKSQRKRLVAYPASKRVPTQATRGSAAANHCHCFSRKNRPPGRGVARSSASVKSVVRHDPRYVPHRVDPSSANGVSGASSSSAMVPRVRRPGSATTLRPTVFRRKNFEGGLEPRAADLHSALERTNVSSVRARLPWEAYDR